MSQQHITFSDYKNFKCINCHSYVILEIYSCKDFSHLTCAQCREYFQKCTLCNTSENDQIRCPNLEEIAKQLKFPCSNELYGCTTLIDYTERSEHESNCEYKQSECPCHCLNNSVHVCKNTQVLQHFSSFRIRDNCSFVLHKNLNWQQFPYEHRNILYSNKQAFSLKWKICLMIRDLVMLSVTCVIIPSFENRSASIQSQPLAHYYQLQLKYEKNHENYIHRIPIDDKDFQKEYIIKIQLDRNQDIYYLSFIVKPNQ